MFVKRNNHDIIFLRMDTIERVGITVMRGIKDFLVPNSLDYALKLLDINQGNALVLGGGTHLALVKNSSHEIIIDIKRAGLGYIKEENNYICIGSAVRAVDIINCDLLKDFAGDILQNAASKIGSPLTQNLVTVGGNIYSMFPWSNLPPAMLVLGAEVVLTSQSGSRKVSLEELLKANPRTFVKKDELIKEVLIPKSAKNMKTSYKTFSTTENDYDMAIVAAGLDFDGKQCKKASIAVGAAVSPASLLKTSGVILEGKEITSELIKESSEKAFSDVKLVKDFRTSQEQIEATVKTLVKRTLEECSK